MGRNVARLLVAASVAIGGMSGLTGPRASAQDAATSPLVIELFTSQGCSSCPPADALLHELAKRDDVIALALHVDYWDYIGWADSFARAEHTQRQKAYARAAGERMIYTPQMILGGQQSVQGAKAMAVMAAIEAWRAEPVAVALKVQRTGGTLLVEARPLRDLSPDLAVQIVRYRPEAEVDILRGENAGRTLTYTNIVTAWDVVAKWDGAKPIAISVELGGPEPAVVIIQEQDHGAILAAALAE